jgi:cell wall-associated NlpC family hydrolase
MKKFKINRVKNIREEYKARHAAAKESGGKKAAKGIQGVVRLGKLKLRFTSRTLFIGGGAMLVLIAAILLLVLIKPQTVTAQGAAASSTPSVSQSAPAVQPGSSPGATESVAPTESPTESPVPSEKPPEAPVLKDGDENEDVKILQQRLMDLNYLDIDEPTARFGPQTKYALELFQRQHKLQIDGICGGETRTILFSDQAKPYTMLEGAFGTDIGAFQKRLKELGYMKKITNYYGSETIAAVKAFQKTNKLTVDGKAGQHTLDLIYSSKAKGPVTIKATVGRNVDKFIAFVKKQLGHHYILGTEGPKTFDCSGLVYYTLTHNGVKTGRLNAAGYSGESRWKKISSMSKLKKGDILFFQTNGKRVGHTGIYIGGGEMIDASSANGRVVRRSCTTSFWRSHFVVARRPWKW